MTLWFLTILHCSTFYWGVGNYDTSCVWERQDTPYASQAACSRDGDDLLKKGIIRLDVTGPRSGNEQVAQYRCDASQAVK